jgi:hypothetical protein
MERATEHLIRYHLQAYHFRSNGFLTKVSIGVGTITQAYFLFIENGYTIISPEKEAAPFRHFFVAFLSIFLMNLRYRNTIHEHVTLHVHVHSQYLQ